MSARRFILAVICVLFVTAVQSGHLKEFRNVTTEFLKAESTNMTCTNLIHTVSVGARDTLHYIYSTLGRPSVLVAKTTDDAKMSVDWEKFCQNNSTQEESVKFEGGSVLGTALLSFDAIYIFNDTNDMASMNEASNMTRVNTSKLRWSMAEPIEDKEGLVRFISQTHDADKNKTQTVTIEFLSSSGHDYSTPELPHLLLNCNLTQIDVYLENLLHDFVQPRVGLGLTLIASKNYFMSSTLTEEKSLNDELSPGAFRTLNWLNSENKTPEAPVPTEKQTGTFVQWKPISYVSEYRSLRNLTVVSHYELVQVTSAGVEDMPYSLATAVFGRQGLQLNTWMSSLNISFGITGDRFYSKTDFVTWQLTFGIGSHPQGSMSVLVIHLLVIGVGIPVLVMFGGAIYLIVRACLRRKRRGYEELSTSNSYPKIG